VLLDGTVASALTKSPVPLLLAAPGAGYLRREQARAAARRDAEALRTGVTELASAMVGELRAGKPPADSLLAAAETLDGPLRTRLADVVNVARVGGDVPTALTRAAAPPGADALARIAACWRVAAERGAGFAAALSRVAAGLRAEDAGHCEVEAELSGARSTAHLLAVLPAFGLLLGQAVGADPVDVLTHSPLGVGCLVAGLVLIALGLDWTDRIARGGVGWTR
jgi:tight adherence protein B